MQQWFRFSSVFLYGVFIGEFLKLRIFISTITNLVGLYTVKSSITQQHFTCYMSGGYTFRFPGPHIYEPQGERLYIKNLNIQILPSFTLMTSLHFTISDGKDAPSDQYVWL